MNNDAFQKACIDDMVNGHTKARLIDNHYLNQMCNPQLKDHPEQTRKVQKEIKQSH
ncbi:hypothetical protein [Legionella erythra]|uniref:hypothetical protein n=1 Tax=Legionella erythra TaxID=448 RepID=UPI0012E35F43|nr:hypothetical protein [Legionella erythra]